MTSSHWERAWAEEGQDDLDAEYSEALAERARRILDLIDIGASRPRVLYDLGSGAAEVSSALAMATGASVIAVDFNWLALAAAERRRPPSVSMETVLADCTTAAFAAEHRERADLVLSLGLVEHDRDPGLVVARHAVILRPGGHLVLMVPNRRSLVGVSRLLMQATGKWHVGFQREHSPRTARTWCERAGLNVSRALADLRPSYHADPRPTAALSALDRGLAAVLSDWGWYTWVVANKPNSEQ